MPRAKLPPFVSFSGWAISPSLFSIEFDSFVSYSPPPIRPFSLSHLQSYTPSKIRGTCILFTRSMQQNNILPSWSPIPIPVN